MGLNNFNLGFTFTAKNMVSGPALGASSAIRGVQKDVKTAGEQIKQAFFGMQSGMMMVQRGMTALRIVGGVADDFGKFETAMKEVSTLVDTSTTDMGALEEQVLSLSNEFGSMPVDTAKALYGTISAGFSDAADASMVLVSSSKLAIGGVTDTNTALKGMTATLKAWGLEASDSGAVSDAMFVAMKAGQTTIGQLSNSIGGVSAIAAQVGVSFEEVLGAASALTLGGRTTSMAMTGLKSVFTAVVKGSKQATDEAKRLGIEFSTSAIKAMGFQNWIKHVTEKVNGDERAMGKLFGRVEGLGAMFSLGGKQAGDFANIMESMKNKSGETEKAYLKMTNTLAFQQKKMAVAWKILKIEIGRGIAPVMKILYKVMGGIFKVLGWMSKKLPIVSKLLMGLIAGVGIILLLAGAFIVTKFAILGVTIALTAMWVVMAPLLPIIGAIALAVGALVLVGYALKKAYDSNFGGFGDALRLAWYWIDLVIGSMWEMATTGEIVGDRVKGVLSFPWLYDVVQIIGWVRVAFMSLASGIIAGFKSVSSIFDPIKMAVTQLGAVFARIGKTFDGFWDSVGGGTKSRDATSVMEKIKLTGVFIGIMFAKLVEIIALAIGMAIRIVGGFIEYVANGFMSIAKFIDGIIDIFTGNFKRGLGKMVQAVVGFVLGTLNAIGSLLWDLVAMFLNFFGISIGSWEDFKDMVIGVFVSMWEGIVAVFNFLVNSAIEIGKGLAEPFIVAAGLMSNAWNEVASWFVRLWHSVTKPIRAIWDGFGEIFSAAGKGLKKMWTPIYNWFKEKLGWIIGAAEKVYGWGKKVWGGIKSAGSFLTGGGMIDKMKNVVERYQQKKSGKNEFYTEGFPGASDEELAQMKADGEADRSASEEKSLLSGLVTMPAVAQAEGEKASKSRPINVQVTLPPSNIQVKSELTVDGEKLAEAVDSAKNNINERGLTTLVPATSS